MKRLILLTSLLLLIPVLVLAAPAIAQPIHMQTVNIGIRLMAPDAAPADRARLKYIAYCLATNPGASCWLDPSLMPGDAYRKLVDLQREDDGNAAYDFIEGHTRKLIGQFEEAYQEGQ